MMTIAWNPWTLTAIAGAVVAWLMAYFVYRSTPNRALARRTACLSFFEGTAVLTSGAGLARLMTSATAFRSVALVHFAVDWLLVALYLPFLARALDSRLLRVFRARTVEIGLVAVGVAGALSVAFVPGWYIGDVVAVPDGQFRWVSAPGPVWSYLAGLLGLMLVYGFVVSVRASQQAGKELSQRRGRAFTLAFGVRALVWAGIYLLVAFAAERLSADMFFLFLQLYALALLLYIVLVSYGILTAQLFDIDLRIERTVRQCTTAAAFVAVFFLVSEGVKLFLSAQLGSLLGFMAAAVLIFFLAPLRRVAERIAEFAVPGSRSTTEYETFRKMQIYHTALEGAYSDGRSRRKNVRSWTA